MDRRMLTAAAIVAALTLPSAVGAADHSGGFGSHGPRSARFVDGSPSARGFSCAEIRGDRHRGRHDRDLRCDGFGAGWIYADGDWGRYNNRSFEPDSYNDWWNDRPDRAYPRWVQEQQRRGTCDPDRMWWSGTGWHC